MSHTARSLRPTTVALSDVVALAKPRIMALALLTTVATASLAPGALTGAVWLALLVGTGLIVAAANSLNMYLEREIDCKMARTRTRPLPAGRLDPQVALIVGLVEVAASVPILTFGVNPLTGLLGVIAFVSYVMMYTPMKQRSTVSTLVGAVPGAMPALMGWTAMTASIDLGGLVVFGVLFLWQIPHFHAIALFRHKEYQRAGLKILPVERGDEMTRYAILLYLAAQVQLTLLLFALGVAGKWYLISAIVLGAGYFGYALAGLRDGGPRWARRLFLISIVYLPLLFLAMVLDGIH